ncbi:helix-turn-helix transcriptional regulator [Paraburkholderia phosphatilytica]|uniref:helix-turn-helix transcriptional regulator n=1 Tax=Paraburkholderia phosphatilytica TaxID=2282883 RepID=UPI0013E07273|nr:helix-turn-helix transcriptional regulator [Paraburkholderia phosphatilytica]
MYPTVYMALLSALKFRHLLPRYSAAILDGDFSRAYCTVDDAAETAARTGAKPRERGNDELTALADVSLLLDEAEKAEEYYHRAQKRIWKSDQQLRVQSCRNTGWSALMLGRLSVAQRSFGRIASEVEAQAEERIGAYIGMALAHHQLAQQQAADDALMEAAELADTCDEPRYRLMIDLLGQEFDVRLKVRAARALNDHAFWQSALAATSLAANARRRLEPASAIAPRPAIQARRSEELVPLERLAGGERHASAQLLAARARHGAASPRHVFHANLDLMLAALAGGFDDIAADVIDRMPPGHLEEQRRNVDYLYCLAKVAALRGNAEQALKFYARYTAEALRCLRTETPSLRAAHTTTRQRANAAGAGSDDVNARLPAKYRRAYRFIVENIDREDLTTRAVAAELNVTMRTIQLVFKRALGVTPCALIRSMRLEGIRDELLAEHGPAPSVFDTAARWGVKSRSTLSKGYRKYFDESPSETIVAHAR